MNKITKRIFAGASALALLASAIGVDQLADLFMRTSYADGSKGKYAKSTGFSNLEQDTTKNGSEDAYNTGYGLHTNKTATALDDGRTFDVNLESWYVGENPVDVATILDASGSMAWTVDTLEPLVVDTEEKKLLDYFGLTDSEEVDLNNDGKKDINDLIAYQDANGGYLPQNVVDLILDPTKTDNTKLSYADYMYYVYEARSSVSEFVPLGYWDGGIDPKNDDSLIGYYPFSGDLKNKAPKAADGASGMLINHPTGSESSYDPSKPAEETLKGVFGTGERTVNKKTETYIKGLNIADSSSKGAVLVESPKTDKFSIEFELSVDNSGKADSNGNEYDEATILYLTDGTNYYRLYRGGAGSAARLKMAASSGSAPLNANKAVNTEPKEWKFTFDFEKQELTIYTNTSTKELQWVGKDNANASTINGKNTYTVNLKDIGCPTLDKDKLKIYIGGDTEERKNQNNIYIRNLSIKDIVDEETATEVAKYPLQEDLKNTIEGSGRDKAIFVAQPYNNGGNFGETEIGTHLLDPVFKDNKALNVKATSQNGAVSIDAVPELDDDGFTISMKLQRTDILDKKANNQQNIFYYGDKNKNNDYYQYFRSANAGGFLGITKGVQQDFTGTPSGTEMVYYKGGMANNDWYTNTLVFKPDPDSEDKVIITPYINGKPDYQDTVNINTSIASISVNKSDLVLLLCALKKNGSGSEQYLDDLYVFDKALDKEVVNAYFGDNTVSCKVGDDTTHALTYVKDDKGNFEYNEDGSLKTIEIAQISNGEKRLGQNTNIDQRRGWYYVNSASDWKDIAGCLASGKQYIGIFTDDGLKGDYAYMANDTATIPAGFAEGDPKQQEIATEISDGDTSETKYTAPSTERSIRFYVDNQNHLRCFVWSGATTKNKGDERTFCSVVYEKKTEESDGTKQLTKYEELNNALNMFYQNLASYSDLSNSSIVRFSTANMVDKSNTDKTETSLKKLIMKDWTNWSDYYLADMEENKEVENYKPKTENYLQDLLIPADGETATDTEKSSTREDTIEEYPYVMTGGTYTWTGLKAFYDNMVKKDGFSSGDRVYDVANDARDKYLIIFTDGRDNTQDYNVSETESDELNTELAGTPDYNTGSAFLRTDYVGTYNPYAGTSHKVGFSIENYDNHDYNNRGDYKDYPETVQQFKTGDHEIATDGDLAEAWADKLKDEGYTIYCVMLATGSISEYTNKAEYNKAYNFMKSLAGSNEIDEEIADMEKRMEEMLKNGTKPDEIADLQNEMEALKDNKVIVVDQNQGAGGVTKAFQQILEQIQQPREDYNVQDYIDPRFDLVDREGNLYHLGAGGEITVTDSNGDAVKQYKTREGSHNYTYTDEPNTIKVGNIIEPKEGKSTIGLAYTPRDSNMVNRTKYYNDKEDKDYYDNGDGVGTGYIYYDDEKDMYYLRWEDQVIPMEDKTFDTAGSGKTLDVWSATIRLKAKDDFIGGNNILTNGNEAGENLVYSDATIENMDKNPELYFSDGEEEHTLREKLQVLSGTDRKINAVDAGGVSQAVYGDGIDIPSSGFPRTTVNVRLLKLDAKDLNDVIYMGEVVSPTMMLADLEDGYMTGSYYLEYLERYAYRLYGYDAAKTPLLELLNQWLKINDKDATEKTFTIPYIYLPDPIYEGNKLKVEGNKVVVNNSTGMSTEEITIIDSEGSHNITVADFEDLNLRDVTGFITYTWKREDKDVDGDEIPDPEQQQIDPVTGKPDITKDYIAKNTNQIKYNLQLKFTPLKETAAGLDGFDLDTNFIKGDSDGNGAEKFFTINNVDSSDTYLEFVDESVTAWTTAFGREDYLKAMIQEQHTYTPHVIYDTAQGKWALVDDDKEGFTTSNALNAYKGEDKQITVSGNTLTNKGVYDWDKEYKPVQGNTQIEGDKLSDYYTDTLKNVVLADKKGNTITDETGNLIVGKNAEDVFSLVANTTYTKDVVNAALALEIYVDGKYLQSGMHMAKRNTFTFEATRYYDDPLDPLPYGSDTINADALGGKKYQLTFTVDNKSLPTSPASSEIYRLWAELTKVEVYDDTTGDYIPIMGTSDNLYTGYLAEDALPIGTYEISVSDTEMNTTEETSQYYLGKADGESSFGHFQYLKIENDVSSYTHDRFPADVVTASADAVKDTGDNEYQIWNEKSDYSKANIAKNNRVKDSTNQTVTFYFGTVAEKKDGTTTLKNIKGVSVKEYLKANPKDTKLEKFTDDYAKDRLGIIMLSASANSLAISKEVTRTNTSTKSYKTADWDFTVTVTPETGEAASEFKEQNDKGFTLTWYTLDDYGNWQLDSTTHHDNTSLHFDDDGDGTYTANVSLKHHEKVVIGDLSEGTWQVTEVEKTDVTYTPHNDQSVFGEDLWLYNKAYSTRDNIELSPASQVNYVNEFPHELPSTGGSGIVRLIFLGTAFTLCSVMLFAILWYNCRKRRTMKK